MIMNAPWKILTESESYANTSWGWENIFIHSKPYMVLLCNVAGIFNTSSLVNSLSPEGRGSDVTYVIFKYIGVKLTVITFINISNSIAFSWMAQDPSDCKSTLVVHQTIT